MFQVSHLHHNLAPLRGQLHHTMDLYQHHYLSPHQNSIIMEDNFNRLTWLGLLVPIGAGSFSPPNVSGASFWTRSGVDGTSTLVPSRFLDSVTVVMLATVCVEGGNSIVSTISDKFVYCGRRRGHSHIFDERALTNFIAAKK